MTTRTTPVRPGGTHSVLLAALLAASASLGLVSTLSAQTWVVPRTADGHPDLQGNWTNVTLTPFERREGTAPVFTSQQVADIEQVEGDCPANPGTVACGRTASQGQSNEARLSGQEYNEIYWDRGTRVAIVNGEHRSSLLTRPSNGRRPPLTPEAQERLREAREFRSQFGQYDHPELRPLAERCVVSFGSSAGPPMMPNSAYNNNYTIVQNADHVMILAEMVHDVRIIRLGEPDPLDEELLPWFGDSWGHWDGNALVVETTNFNPRHPFRGIPPTDELKVTERFTRVSAGTILYEFTVDDPTTYTEPWGGEIPFNRFNDLVYEYSCHEGNYALGSVLSGARYEETQAGRDGREER